MGTGGSGDGVVGAGSQTLSQVECWCCGAWQPESAVVRLGDHPEVAVCLGCAHFLHRRARAYEDVGVRSPTAAGRGVLRSATRLVVDRGWHQRPVIGPVVRWLGPRLP